MSPSRFRKLLLATDGSASAQQAAEVAARIAKSFGSEVTILSVIPSAGVKVEARGAFQSKLLKKGSANTEQAAAVFKKAGVAVAEVELPQGRASTADAIVKQATRDKTDLIIMGTRGLGGFRRVLLGSVSSAVAAHAPCATLVVRKDGDRGMGRVLVAIDDSPYAQRALETAVEMAAGLRAELRIAHVVYIQSLFWSMSVPGSAVPTDKIEQDAEKASRDLLAKAARFAKSKGVDVKEELVTQLVSPAQGIVELAASDGVDVIVVGTRGNGGFRKLVLGSVANSILHYAESSVLVTK